MLASEHENLAHENTTVSQVIRKWFCMRISACNGAEI